ncbi:hypothetical protein MKEN_00425900 [Mycena kentingensis (nom. inval.)]|nr:hypothetical protein MKEN_00425900 [Mycena kentingensis (nom. inval.)]
MNEPEPPPKTAAERDELRREAARRRMREYGVDQHTCSQLSNFRYRKRIRKADTLQSVILLTRAKLSSRAYVLRQREKRNRSEASNALLQLQQQAKVKPGH